MQKLHILTFSDNYNNFLLQPLPIWNLLSSYWCLLYQAFPFPTGWEDKEASHGELCEHMLGGMIMQTCVHTRQTWSFAIFLPTGLPVVNITLICLMCILTYNTTIFKKRRYNLGYAAGLHVIDCCLLTSHQYAIIWKGAVECVQCLR